MTFREKKNFYDRSCFTYTHESARRASPKIIANDDSTQLLLSLTLISFVEYKIDKKMFSYLLPTKDLDMYISNFNEDVFNSCLRN